MLPCVYESLEEDSDLDLLPPGCILLHFLASLFRRHWFLTLVSMTHDIITMLIRAYDYK